MLTRLLEKLSRFYVVTLAIAVLALRTFVAIAEKMAGQTAGALNNQILLGIHAYAHPALDAAALALAAIGSLEGVVITAVAFAAWLIRRHRPLDAAVLAAAVIGTAVLTFTIKASYQHPRPALFPRLAEELSYSFPSGHASMSMCLYGFIGGWIVSQGPREPWRWVVATLCFDFAIAIGASRLYLGVHWPTDVLAGEAIAIFWLAVCLAGRRWVAGRHQPDV